MINNQINYGEKIKDATVISKEMMMDTIGYNNNGKVIGDAPMIYHHEYANIAIPSYSWSSICYGNGKFVAVASGTAAYSTDGINWTSSTLPGRWSSVCYGNGKFVAVSRGWSDEGYKVAAYSTDGINWKYTSLPTEESWGSVCYGDGMFVAVANGGDTGEYVNSNVAAYSTDGINWTKSTLPASAYWNSVCYGNGMFVAVAWGVGTSDAGYKKAAYSTTGKSWSSSTLPSKEFWSSVCYGDGKFVAVADCSDDYEYMAVYSTDGKSWSSSTLTSSGWVSVCYGNGMFVAVDEPTISASFDTSGTGYIRITYSTDGINWTITSTSVSGFWATDYSTVCYGNGMFVIVMDCSHDVVYSTDGINWSKQCMRDLYELIIPEQGIKITSADGKYTEIFTFSDGQLTRTESSN